MTAPFRKREHAPDPETQAKWRKVRISIRGLTGDELAFHDVMLPLSLAGTDEEKRWFVNAAYAAYLDAAHAQAHAPA